MNEITTQEELDALLKQSSEAPVFLFKHSTTCPISSRARARVDDYIDNAENHTPSITMIKVIESRPVSNAIADTLHVTHQSPQLILVKDGKSVWNASHHNINAENIDAALADL